MSCILGINYFFHDSSACLLIDGKLVAALEEERFTRQKHTREFPTQAIERCLGLAGLSARDIDHIAVSIKPTKDILKKVAYGLSHPLKLRPFLGHELLNGYHRQRDFGKWYARQFAGLASPPPVHFVPHHLAHAAGTFLVSPYEEAAILSIDGSGEWATSYLGIGRGIDVTNLGESFFPMSLGSFYEAATEFCGFRPNHDEGKTMGLAPFGDAARFHDVVSRMARVDAAGRIHVDLSYFDYQFCGHRRCGGKFHATFGKPRTGNGEFEAHQHDVAAAFQRVLEECGLELARQLRRRTKARHLVIGGGVALNSVMNGRLLRESGFDDIYVMPAAGDNGTAIGAACYVYNTILRQPRRLVHDDPYLGTHYSDAEIEKQLIKCKLPYAKCTDIAASAARLLAQGNILGWLQGRMEIGPRALGNRSILANAARPETKSKINAEVKLREAYRPFAPSTPLADKDRYFDIQGESPFMLKVCDVLPGARELIPSVTHVDGTARLQTVRPEINPLYHDLLTKFGAATGVPVLLNTSFNIQGEPLVESPTQALRCFFSTGLDYLAMGSFLVGKRGVPAAD